LDPHAANPTVHQKGIRVSERIQTLHPDPEKTGPRIIRWKYDAVRGALLRAIPRKEPGFLFKELPAKVRSLLGGKVLKELGSVTWYTTTVKLDLEARGEIARVCNSRPQRLVRLK
jgi:hypothetical protein